jgi:hypothetical protein
MLNGKDVAAQSRVETGHMVEQTRAHFIAVRHVKIFGTVSPRSMTSLINSPHFAFDLQINEISLKCYRK